MGFWLTVAGVAAVINVLLLVVLVRIWGRNYLRLRSKHAIGLSVFGVLLLLENLLAFYYYVLDPQVAQLLQSAAPVAGRAMSFVQVLELAALLFLAWVTLD
jgi:hypothetical protein